MANTERQRLVFDLEQTALHPRGPIYSVTPKLFKKLRKQLAKAGWNVIAYGDESATGSFKAFRPVGGWRE